MNDSAHPKPTVLYEEDLTVKDVLNVVKKWFMYLLSRWWIIGIAGFIGLGIGVIYASYQKILYVGALSFVVEDDRSGGGMSGAMGLASSLGIDVSTGGGSAFSGANLIELMKSRMIIEKSLLHPIVVNAQTRSLADYYIEINKINEAWKGDPVLSNLKFEPMADRSKFSFLQDSIMGRLYASILQQKNGGVSIAQKDKKVLIWTIEVRSENELFAKVFAESITKVVSDFYIETKSLKARNNVIVLENQTDSVRNELNNAIVGVAAKSDNIYNLNPALNIKRAPSSQRQIDVQANTAILTQLVANLEMAKLTLLKETPLIQVIDRPILPLRKEKLGKTKAGINGFLLAVFFATIILMVVKFIRDQFTA